ncbi:hypothetical protein [Pandoraea sp. NPDC087047]|uniref:hypothetical protein n=1 Tax=Pandoraea sp. NPDC087047 TaxID=3364390 RepID=UPI003821B7FD
MTRRRLLLWGSLISSVVAALVDPSLLPFFPSSSSTATIAAPVTHARPHAPSPAGQTVASVRPKVASDANADADADVDADAAANAAAERRELLEQVRAFVAGSGPSVDAATIVPPTPRENLASEGDTPAAQRLFVSQNWGPPPPAPSSAPVPIAPLPPTAPPMPFTYLGKAQSAGAWEVYLARGEKTFIVHENSVVDDVYRVASIKPPRLSLIYIPMNQQQELDIGGAQ